MKPRIGFLNSGAEWKFIPGSYPPDSAGSASQTQQPGEESGNLERFGGIT